MIRIISITLLLFGAVEMWTICRAEPEPIPMVSEIIVTIQGVDCNQTEWIRMAKSLIRVRENEPFSESAIQQTAEALKQSRQFEDIHIDTVPDNGKLKVEFVLKPFARIKDIRIDGAYPLFERDILKVMTIYTGDAYIAAELPKQAQRIEQLFMKEGFINPNVEISAVTENGDYVIFITIRKGAYYQLKSLDIQGNHFFSDARLKIRMKTWGTSLLPGMTGRFTEEMLKNDVKSLIEFYRTKRFPDVAVNYTLQKEPDTHVVRVGITIAEGPRYEIEFDGNHEFWGFTLKDDVEVFTSGNPNDAGIRKSLQNIKERYRNAGYLSADIQAEDLIQSDELGRYRKIRFRIHEGPRSIVESVQISGNRFFDERKLQQQILTRKPGWLHSGAYVPDILKEDLNAIRSLYVQQGFSDAAVTEDVQKDPIGKTVAVTLQVHEGIQTIVSNVAFKGLTVLSEDHALKAIRLKTGEPFRSYMMQSDQNALEALISEKGYPHVKVTGEAVLNSDKSEARITYQVDEGPYTEMGSIFYSGNFRTQKRILDREIELKPGEPFSLTQMMKAQKNLKDMAIFNSVQVNTVGLKDKADTVNLFVELEEKKPYYIQAGVGYDTERFFYAHVKAGDQNLFGADKEAWIGGEISEIGYRADAGLIEPRFFDTRIAATLGLFAERTAEFNQVFGTAAYGASLGFSKKLTEQIRADLNFRAEQRYQFSQDGDSRDEEIFNYRKIVAVTPSLTYDSRDSFSRPKKGIFSSLSVDMSKGLGGNTLDDFFKYRFDLRGYVSPWKRLTFAGIGRIGYIDSYNDTGIVPDDQLFFLGGTSDVRGFSENLLQYDAIGKPVGGKSSVSGSLEARFDLGMNFEFTAFYDTGQISEPLNGNGGDEYRSSVGAGIRYITPVGPIGFLYGFKLNPRDGESAGRLHFSLGYTF